MHDVAVHQPGETSGRTEKEDKTFNPLGTPFSHRGQKHLKKNRRNRTLFQMYPRYCRHRLTCEKQCLKSSHFTAALALSVGSDLHLLYFPVCFRVNCFQLRCISAPAQCVCSLICRRQNQKKSLCRNDRRVVCLVLGSPKTPYQRD